MKYYIQIDKNNRVIGYSSNKMFENDLEFLENELEEKFLNLSMFYRFDSVKNKLVFDENLKEKYLKEKATRLSDSEKIDYLTKQLATEKLEGMKKDLTMKMLIQQQAQNKLEIMKLKGSN